MGQKKTEGRRERRNDRGTQVATHAFRAAKHAVTPHCREKKKRTSVGKRRDSTRWEEGEGERKEEMRRDRERDEVERARGREREKECESGVKRKGEEGA